MTPTRRRRAATAITALALALGTAAPASAMPAFQSSSPIVHHANSANSDSEWAYVAIGGGAAGLALLGVGGAVADSRRRERQARHPRSMIEA
jgi:hypothetical protein